MAWVHKVLHHLRLARGQVVEHHLAPRVGQFNRLIAALHNLSELTLLFILTHILGHVLSILSFVLFSLGLLPLRI